MSRGPEDSSIRERGDGHVLAGGGLTGSALIGGTAVSAAGDADLGNLPGEGRGGFIRGPGSTVVAAMDNFEVTNRTQQLQHHLQQQQQQQQQQHGAMPRWPTGGSSSSSTDSAVSPETAMEINNRLASLSHKDKPNAPHLMYGQGGMMSLANEPELQGQLMSMDKQYRLQEEMLRGQFEEQRRMLAHEQQEKVQEYFKIVMLQKQQEQLLQQQKMMEEQRREKERREMERLDLIKNKGKDEQSAIASTEVKQKLRDILLSKGRDNHLKNSPPDFRQWATQHSSLEQHSPPTSGLSPPLRAAHLLGRYDDEYPLRKTASEPNLKVRLALKQKMIERRSSPLLRRKERGFGKRNTAPLTIDTTLSNSNPDSGPNSPPGSSHGSHGSGSGSGEMPQDKVQSAAVGCEGANTAFPLQMMSKMVINQSMPNISIGLPREKLGGAGVLPSGDCPGGGGLSLSASELELRARIATAAQYGMPLLTGSYSFLPVPPVPEGEMSPTNPALVEAQMKALELARSTGQLAISAIPGVPYSLYNSAAGLQEAVATQARLQRPLLLRTQSAPVPLPGHLLWPQHQMLLQKQQEQLVRETQKHYLKQKLQTTLLNRSGSKNQMEHVDEAAEARLLQSEHEASLDKEVVIIEDKEDQVTTLHQQPPHHPAAAAPSRDRESFLMKMRQHSLLGGSVPSATSSASIPHKPIERAQSSPIMSIPQPAGEARSTSSTGLAYDTLMLKHHCRCGSNVGHPEHPGRLQSIWARLQETSLASQCERIKSRKATPEELRTCHSEPYVHMYGSSPHKLDPQIFETFLPRFVKLSCGGVGVDSDTVWNELYTPQAARIAAGCVIDLAFKIARGEMQNGFALVRPPGHHAEDTQAMGFCYFNSIAVATKLLLERLQMKRILILDWDIHHGNSTQQLFYTDPRVLYMSLHRHDNGNFFPGTGAPEDCGIDRGVGYNVNVAWSGSLSPPMTDAEYMAAFRAIIMPIARKFQPEIVLVSAGFDAATGHPAPLGGYKVSAECFGHMTKQLQTLAEGKLLLVLEGGYELQPICDASEMCLRSLLGEEIPLLKEEEMCRSPAPVAIETLKTTMKCQAEYWPCLVPYAGSLDWSIVETQQRERLEADTMSAFASLSVVPGSPKSPPRTTAHPDSTVILPRALEPMEES